MASDKETNTRDDAGQSNGDIIMADILMDIYDLKVVSSLLKADPNSFFAAYGRGDWDPSSIPPVPRELAHILGETQENIRPSLNSERCESPPPLEKSVEEAYLTYLADAKTPGSSDLHRKSSLDANRVGYFLSDSHNDALSSLENTITSPTEAKPDTLLPGNNTEASSKELRSRSNSTSTAPFCTTALSPSLSQEAVSRFIATGYLEAPISGDEMHRRMAIRRYYPLGDHIDHNLDRILRLSKMKFSANIAGISLVDTDYVHGRVADAPPFTLPRGDSMCSHTILVKKINEPLVILDTLQDWRFRNNPTVTGTWSMRFYAGFPLRTKDGFNIGTMCILDDKPRTSFSDHEKAELHEFAHMVLHELDSRQHERQAKTRDLMQSSLEAFNRDLVSQSQPIEQVASRLVDAIVSTLNLDGVLIVDTQNAPNRRPEDTLDGYKFSLLAATPEATVNFNFLDANYANLMEILKKSPSGVCYDADFALPHPLRDLLPSGSTAAAAALIFRGVGRPPAIICVYTTQPNFAFEIPESLLTYIKAMGSVLCTMQEKQMLSLADKAKADFIANVSHELRTPLHGVLASCDLLHETNLSVAQKSLLDTAQGCASSLTETINHVLDFTKATSRLSNSTREAVDLGWLIESTMNGGWLRGATGSPDESAIGELYRAEKQTDTSIESDQFVEPIIEIQPVDNWTVLVDKAGLRRILLNLIGNSMRFTRNGYVKVGLYRIGTDEGARRKIEIVVEDTGVGMSQDFIRERLFHPFSQADSYSHGIGLGLAIVRSILKSSGIDGTIDVQSKLGVGTRITVHLTATVVKPEDNGSYPVPNAPINSTLPPTAWYGFRAEHQGSVLLRNSLRQSLAWWGCEIPEVDISEAKLLIVDSDGIDIASLPKLITSTPKIFLLCSVPMDSNVFKFAQDYTGRGGFCLTLMKPLGPHFLARALTETLDGSTRTLSIIAVDSPKLNLPISVGTTDNGIDNGRKSLTRHVDRTESYSQLRVLAAEDNSANRKVLAAFLRKRKCELVEACDGTEAVHIFRKYPSGYFHVILMDLQMPLKDGFQAAKEIRSIESDRLSSRTAKNTVFQPAQIYALTGLASSEDKDRATTIGFNGYLVKPMAFKVLDAILKSVLEGIHANVA